MSNVLYRKYRSKSFDEIIGQETVVSILKESILKDNISHAYLFCGPRGTGKTSIARIFSRAVNCLQFEKDGDVCNECENCLLISNNQSMDIVEMDAASNRGIEEIRSLKDSVNYLPTALKKKVYIIDEAHMLTKEAFNALLKTLEEPPEHVIFILATTEAHKLPITILSRVERYDFRLATKEEMIKKLKFIIDNEKKKAKDDVWDVIYTKSGGSFRDAESLLGKIISNSTEKTLTKEFIFNVLGIYSEDDITNLVKALINKDFKGFKESLDSLNNLSGNINTLLDQILEVLHNILIENIMKGNSGNEYAELINLVIKTKKDIRDFSDKKLILELNIINFMNRGTPQSVQIQQISAPKAEVISNKKEESISKSKPVLATPQVSGGNILSQIAMHPEITLPRLKAILMNSNHNVDGRKLIIQNRYKFNIAFLEKQENKTMILNVITALSLNFSDIIFELGSGEQSQTETNIELIQEPAAKVEEDKEEGSIDNSDIIENIL